MELLSSFSDLHTVRSALKRSCGKSRGKLNVGPLVCTGSRRGLLARPRPLSSSGPYIVLQNTSVCCVLSWLCRHRWQVEELRPDCCILAAILRAPTLHRSPALPQILRCAAAFARSRSRWRCLPGVSTGCMQRASDVEDLTDLSAHRARFRPARRHRHRAPFVEVD